MPTTVPIPTGSPAAHHRCRSAITSRTRDHLHQSFQRVQRSGICRHAGDSGGGGRARSTARPEAYPIRSRLGRLLNVHTDERAWRIGADGEEKVAARLAKVAKKDPRWRFIHAIPVGNRGSDIDHLIIGPGGVFTANAKHHPGAKIWVGGSTFMVNGTRQPYVRNARHEATRAADILTTACGFPCTWRA